MGRVSDTGSLAHTRTQLCLASHTREASHLSSVPPSIHVQEADAEEKKRLRDLLWKLREGGVADNPEELTQATFRASRLVT